MEGQYKGFRWRIDGDRLIVASADPQLGDLKSYALGSGPETDSEARSLARGRIDLDEEELSRLEIAKERPQASS